MRKSFPVFAALTLLAGCASATPVEQQSSQRATAMIPYNPAVPYVKQTTSAAVAQPVSPWTGAPTDGTSANPQMNNPHVNPQVGNPNVNNPRR